VILPNRTEDAEVRLSTDKAVWLTELIRAATPTRDKRGEKYPSLKEVRARYPLGGPRGFDILFRAPAWEKVRKAGLLLV
jgi:hypothetical protein